MENQVSILPLLLMTLVTLTVLAVLAPEDANATSTHFANANTETVRDDYTFEGRLRTQLSDRLEGLEGSTAVDLEGVQIRVVRKGSPRNSTVGVHDLTDASGEFSVTQRFDSDRGGIFGGGDIRFKVQARFRNDDLKIRKGGLLRNNWFTIAEVQGRNGEDFDVSDGLGVVLDRDDLVGEHAQIWWVYQRALQRLDAEGLGLPRKLTVTYPQQHAYRLNDREASFAIHNVFIGSDDGPDDNDAPETMMHEMFHVWHVRHLRGDASPKCIADAHHKSPERWASSRCSGFMEGFAQAAAEEFSRIVFGANRTDANTLQAMRNGPEGNSYSIRTTGEAERTDEGWENFLTFMWQDNVWTTFSSVSDATCNPTDVPLFDFLEALQEENMRVGQATFSGVTDVLERRVAGFGTRDATFYEMLGDPANTAPDIHATICGGTETTTNPLAPASDFSGTWDTSFGELRLQQTGEYVVGDYAGNGVMVGKVSGSCMAGVFTNGKRNGVFRFDASSSGSGRFEGQWAWHGNSLGGTWNGTRTSASVTQLQNFTRDGAATRVIDNGRTVYDGTYGSSYGSLKLFARDLFLIGDYAGKGILAGMWDGNSYVGRFTNGNRTGWFDFAFFSRNGSFRSGEWGWDEDSEGSWRLNKTSSQTPTLTNMLDDVSCN